MPISFTALVSLVVRHRFSVIFAFMLGLTLTLVSLHFVPASYLASSYLMIGQGSSDDAAQKLSERAAAAARISETDTAIQQAIDLVGLERISASYKSTSLDRFIARLRMSPNNEDVPDNPEYRQQYLRALIAKDIKTQVEPKTNVIEIDYYNRDRELASDFVNAIAQAVVRTQNGLQSQPEAVSFFEQQKSHFEREALDASRTLEEFTVAHSIFNIDDQRSLLIKRSNDAGYSLSTTKGSITEKEGERKALTEQLLKLKPVTLSPFVSSVVTSLGSPGAGEPEAAQKLSGGSSTDSNRSRSLNENNYPLLMVKVYQDSLSELMKVDAELAGLKNLEVMQTSDLKTITGQLVELASKEQDFRVLKARYEVAMGNAQKYTARMFDEKLNSDLSSSKVAAVRYFQSAAPPLYPAFPKRSFSLALGLCVGALLAVLTGLLLDWRTRPLRNPGSSQLNVQTG